MKYLKYYLCILSLLIGASFFAAAEEEADTEDASTEIASANTVAEQDLDLSDDKPQKRSAGNKKSAKGLLFTVGGGLGINIPSVEIVHDGFNNWNDGDTKTNVFVAFGINALVNMSLTYEVKSSWAIGAAINLGYSFMGGPHALFEHRYQNEKYSNTYKGFGKMYSSFIADLNFAVRYEALSKGDLLFEIGARLMPTWGCNVYHDGEWKIGEKAVGKKEYINPFEDDQTEYFEYQGTESSMMAGPDMFMGIDFFVKEHLDIICGLRFGAAFGCGNTKYIDNNVNRQSYLNSIITIALEARINYCNKF